MTPIQFQAKHLIFIILWKICSFFAVCFCIYKLLWSDIAEKFPSAQCNFINFVYFSHLDISSFFLSQISFCLVSLLKETWKDLFSLPYYCFSHSILLVHYSCALMTRVLHYFNSRLHFQLTAFLEERNRQLFVGWDKL